MPVCDCIHDVGSLSQQRPSQQQQYPLPLLPDVTTQPSSTMSFEPKQPPRRPAPFRAGSVGIRRLPSATDSASIRLSTPTQAAPLDRIRSNTDGYASGTADHHNTEQSTGRRRSFSAPQTVDYEYVGRNTEERQQTRPESGFSQQSRPLSGGTYLQDIAEGVEGRAPGGAGASSGSLVAELPGSVHRQQDEGQRRSRRESVASSTDTHSVTKRLRSATTSGGFFSRRKAEQPPNLHRGKSEIGMRKTGRPESKDYESSVVDVLDVMGTFARNSIRHVPSLTLNNRSIRIDTNDSQQCTKFSLHSRSRSLPQPKTNIRALWTSVRERKGTRRSTRSTRCFKSSRRRPTWAYKRRRSK